MLDKFLSKFKIVSTDIKNDSNFFYKDAPFELLKILELFGGTTIEKGLYRIHSFESSVNWSLIIAEYFDEYKNRVYPFGFDWMGRQFCLSTSGNILFMFDPATGEIFELRQSIILLHDEDFVNDTDDMLSLNLFYKILDFYKIDNIEYNECLGYKLPLFLGGMDDIENYELQDIEVYWHIEGQLYSKVKKIPGGTIVNNIKIE